jgi:glucose-1-phosphate cytidylyltransferase
MKTIILAGGLGSRLSEETQEKPKPMIIINDKPMIAHIMDIYLTNGYSEFVIALGYKGELIKRWVIDQQDLDGNIFVDFENDLAIREKNLKNSKTKIHALDTGMNSETGGRIQSCMEKFKGESIMATYGDGLGNIDIKELVNFHKYHGKLATITAVRPPARFGEVKIDEGKVIEFMGV